MDTWLTGPQVAEIIGVDRATVQRIPHDVLPYQETPGGSSRRGRRKYRADHVEAYRVQLTGGGNLGQEEIRALRKRVSAIEAQLRDALDKKDRQG